MLELIRRVGREFGISIVISTHLMGDVERVCDAVVVLDAGRLLRTGAVSGFTEETETLERRARRRRRGAGRGAGRRGLTARLDGSRLTLENVSGEDYDTLRDAIVETNALLYRLAPARLSLADVFSPVPARRRGGASLVTTGPGEVFDLGYRGYEGERTGRWSRRRAIWRDGVRISLGLGRGSGAKFTSWLLIGLALVPIVVLVVISAFLAPLEEAAEDFELPSYADYYDWAIVPLGLFAAVVAPLLLCPDRRDGVLSLYAARPITPADYVGARWAAFLTVSALAAWLPAAILFTWNALDASSPGRGSATTGTWCRGSSPPGATVALVLTTLVALRGVVHDAARVRGRRDPRGALRRLRDRRDRRGELLGPVSDALSLASVPQAIVDSVHWTSATPSPTRPLPGWVSTLWLAG